MTFHNRHRAFRLAALTFQNIALLARSVILQPLLAALERNLTGLQIALRQIRRQHGVFPRQNGHGVDMLDDKLTVGHPKFHIVQVAGIKRRFLHSLIQRVEQRIVRLIDGDPLPGELLR